MATIRFAEEAVATSFGNGAPLFLMTNATKVAKFAVKMNAKSLLYVEKKLTEGKVNDSASNLNNALHTLQIPG